MSGITIYLSKVVVKGYGVKDTVKEKLSRVEII